MRSGLTGGPPTPARRRSCQWYDISHGVGLYCGSFYPFYCCIYIIAIIILKLFSVTPDQVGYILGLGDRHPSNLMLDRYSGKLLHIDFGDCFEASMTREKFPEKVGVGDCGDGIIPSIRMV